MAFIDLFKKRKKAKKPAKKAEKKPEKTRKEEKAKASSHAALEIDREIWPIKAVAIVEILGAPKEYVLEALNAYIEKMKKEKEIMILDVEKSEVEQKDKLFSIFAEIGILAQKPSRLVDYCFDYMPSSIEIIEPESIKFSTYGLSNFFNDLQARLHNLDMIVKNLRAENEILSKNAHLILRNNILLSLREAEKDLASIAKNIGIAEEKTKAFLDALVKQGFINIKKNKYSLNKEKVKFSE